jgi:NTE family protein
LTKRRATLVLSGGGAKGAFQVGAEQVLREEGGFEWERIFGVSVGALNGALLAQREYDRLLKIWQRVRREDIYRKPWWLWIPWRLVILHKAGIYDNRPLRVSIQKQIAGRPFHVPLHVGRVSLVSGAYESVRSDQSTEPELLDALWQSATMAVIWEPIGPRALVDGSLRNVTPLGDALDFTPTELIVLNCSPDHPDVVPRPRDILDAARRSLMDITINEIMVDDVREFIRLNSLVKQAKRKGFTLEHEDGTPYVDCTIGVLRPRGPLGDNLDFSRQAIDARIESGRQVARDYLAGARVTVS